MASPANRRRAREGRNRFVHHGRFGTRRAHFARRFDRGGACRSGSGSGGSAPVPAPQAAAHRAPPAAASPAPETTEIKVIGVRRVHCRAHERGQTQHSAFRLRGGGGRDGTRIAAAASEREAGEGRAGSDVSPADHPGADAVLELFPQCNVLYDAARGVLVRHRAVHVGRGDPNAGRTQSPGGSQCRARRLWEIAAEIRRLSERARSNKATRDELVGSTITVTSLGKLGGIASTPVINAPEVAIIGLNKAVDRPVVHHGAVTVRRIMNLSSSFDHRFVDGYDAAAMIQALKELLEHPAMIFIPKVKTSSTVRNPSDPRSAPY